MGGPHGGRRLEFSQFPLIDGYAVQNAFGFFRLNRGKVETPGKCVFVGTADEFRGDGRDCQSWESGQSVPPKFKRQIRLHKPNDGGIPRVGNLYSQYQILTALGS